ncbi:MAG: hypothetical protein IPH62_05900 [Ignavibacteriae bacterium]|nr:hypothetical protein [Ignavibacteriota bacterium]
MATQKYKITNWDSGWYQIRRCLIEHNIGNDKIDELKKLNSDLAVKILPQIEEYGFLDRDEVYEEI